MASHVVDFLALCSPDSRHTASRGQALLRPDGAGGPLPRHPVGRDARTPHTLTGRRPARLCVDPVLCGWEQDQLRLPGGAAVCVPGLRGAGRGGGDGRVSGAGLVQRHVLRTRLRDAGSICHHDTEGLYQPSIVPVGQRSPTPGHSPTTTFF